MVGTTTEYGVRMAASEIPGCQTRKGVPKEAQE